MSVLRKLTLAAAVVAAASGVAPTAAASGATAVNATSAASARNVVVSLITGEAVGVTRSGGHDSYSLLPGQRNPGFQEIRDPGGDYYLIPAEAVPYLGHGLDRSLFDLTALARNGSSASARIRVHLSFAAGAAHTAPPGITITSTLGSSADAYLTAGSGASFAAALRRAIGADVAAGRTPGTTPAFPGISSIAAASASPPAQVVPHYPLHPVQFNVTNLEGVPADADVGVINVDAAQREFVELAVVNGVARLNAPSGHYTAVSIFPDYDANGDLTTFHMVLTNDFFVPDTGTTTTVTVSERVADSPVSAVFPRPVGPSFNSASITRGASKTDVAGFGVAFGADFSGNTIPLYVNAAKSPKVGILRYALQFSAAAPKVTDAYQYNVAFASTNGISRDQKHIVRARQLATVNENLYADPLAAQVKQLAQPGLAAVAVDPIAGGVPALALPQAFGQNVTQYLGTASGASWAEAAFGPGRVIGGSPHQFTAGATYTESWGKGPNAPGMNQVTGDLPCYVCSAGTTVVIALNDTGDSVPDHGGQLAEPMQPTTEHLTVYRDGAKVFDRDDTDGAALQSPSGAAGTFRAVFDYNLTGLSGFSQSTTTHTELTIRSNPKTDPVYAIPGGQVCIGQSTSSPCRVLPAMLLSYTLAATDFTNTSTATEQILNLTVGHTSFNTIGSHSPITSATVAVSYDDEKTWQPAGITGTAGHYTAQWPNSGQPLGATPSIRVTATDADGDAITQTIGHAYTVGGAK